jgi:iron complex outermembrane receptor protein
MRSRIFLYTAGLMASSTLFTTPTLAQQVQVAETSVQEAIIVTGVRGGKPRTVADSPAPIDVLSAEGFQRTGRAELGEALAAQLPSFNFGTNIAGINSIVRPVSNRGMGPAYTLVLVNGKRRHNGALLTNGGGDTSGVNPVDLDLIPLSAVESFEVLKDSAAAQYGSDAVAGVVNVQLKSRREGGHIGLSWGSLYDGEGDLQTKKLEADFAVPLGEEGFIHFSADARKRGMAWWNFPATNLTAYSPASNPKNATWNRDGAHNGDPEIKAYNFSYNAELPLQNGVTLYSFTTGGLRETVIGNNYRRPNSLANIASLFPDGYFPLNNTRENDLQSVWGAKGDLSGWDWDLSASYGRNRNHQYSDFTINPSLGPSTPTSFDSLATYQFEQSVANLDVTRGFEVGLAEPLQFSWGAEGRIDRFATYAGDPLAYVNGGYVFKAGDQEGDPNVGKTASVGAQAAVTLSKADETRLVRRSVAGYADLGLYPVEDWFVDLAVRVENYDDSSGTTAGGKINSRYDFNDFIAVRGTVGTGFRAPSLTQLGYAQTDNRTNIDAAGNVVPSLSKLARTGSALAEALGGEDLKPEKSVNFGLGFVLRPLDRVNLTVDAYQVKVDDRIVRSGYLYGPALTSLLLANGLSGTEWVQYFANAVDTRTRGVDVVADTTLDLDAFGDLKLEAAFNYNKTKITHIIDTPSELLGLGSNTGGSLIFFGRAAQGDLTVANPETKLILGSTWTWDRFTVASRVTRYGSYIWQRTENVAQDVKFGAKWLTDLDVGVELSEGLRVNIGANNIFDVRPDKNGPGDAVTGGSSFYYGPSPFSPSGGTYYARISYDF